MLVRDSDVLCVCIYDGREVVERGWQQEIVAAASVNK